MSSVSFATYRRVLSLPGALLFSVSGLVARLPISMVGLGMVLLVEAETGSYGLAGIVSAVYVLSNSAFAILHGRLTDAFGQSRVLPPVIVVFGVALALMMAAVQAGWPIWTVLALAALTGTALPQVGACVRARWSHVLSSDVLGRQAGGKAEESPGEVSDQIGTAYAFESVLDEVVFVVGPVLATLLATAWHPVAGLTVALLSGVLGTLAYAAQRRTEPPAHRHHRETGERPALPWATLLPLTAVALALGTLFGAVEVATVAFAEEQGAPAMAGVLLAILSFGSLLAGLLTGAVTWRAGSAVRMRWGTLALTVSLAPVPFLDSLLVMGPVLFVAGFAIAPTLIALSSLVQQTVPTVRLTEGMAVLHTGLAAGVAPGAALAGVVIDAYGASTAYLLPVAAGLVGVASALSVRTRGPAGEPGARRVGSAVTG